MRLRSAALAWFAALAAGLTFAATATAIHRARRRGERRLRSRLRPDQRHLREFDPRKRSVCRWHADSGGSGSANTYRVLPSGALSPAGTAAANGQGATCWLVEARGYRYATNTASDTITGYLEAPDGQLELLHADGVSATTDAGPIDIAAAPDGRQVFELNGLAGDLGVYAVAPDGALTSLPRSVDCPPTTDRTAWRASSPPERWSAGDSSGPAAAIRCAERSAPRPIGVPYPLIGHRA